MAHPWAGKIARKRNMEDKCRRANRPLTRAICHLFRFTSQTAYVPEPVRSNTPAPQRQAREENTKDLIIIE
jgi:hypothetical protein